MFIPSNVPVLLLPFLAVIEVISHVAKIFSLAIRLFANMMSGHVLLHILTGFVLDLGKKSILFTIFPSILIFSIVCLEYGITALQAYVFLTLLAIYFEEHFGFTREFLSKILRLISINGLRSSIYKYFFMLRRFIFRLQRLLDFHYLILDNKVRRARGRFVRHFKWRIAVFSLSFQRYREI